MFENRTWGGRMEGANDSTELRRHPSWLWLNAGTILQKEPEKKMLVIDTFWKCRYYIDGGQTGTILFRRIVP